MSDSDDIIESLEKYLREVVDIRSSPCGYSDDEHKVIPDEVSCSDEIKYDSYPTTKVSNIVGSSSLIVEVMI